MSGPFVWLCVLVSVVIIDSTTNPAPPSQTSNCGPVVSSLMQTLGLLPDCLASTLGQFTSLVEDMREILREARPPVRPCPGRIIEEGEQWRWRPRHCKDLLEEGDSGRGVRQVYPFPGRPNDAADVYCDHTVDGGGWTVLVRRTNNTNRENFYRNWTEYVQGFGNLTGEFWMGLQLLHTLTNFSGQHLRVDMADYDGVQRWAKYDMFKVGPTQDHFRLTVGSYTGDAGNSLAYNNGMQFTTYDADHDSRSDNCAVKGKGGWWYKSCTNVNPTGFQYEGAGAPAGKGIVWHHWRGNTYSLMYTTYMIRPVF